MDYSWVLEYLKNIYSEASLKISKYIATDKAGGLILAVIQIFPDVPYILYIWHVNNDVKIYGRRF
jgi:hypothetical protein